MVDYPAGPSPWLSRVWLVIWSFALSMQVLWLLESERGDWRPWCGIALTAMAAAVALRIGRIASDGNLLWDGDAWWWGHAALRTRGVVTCELDVYSLMLLCFVSDKGPRVWLVLGRSADPARWLDLRRAVHAPTLWSDSGRVGERMVQGTDRAVEP